MRKAEYNKPSSEYGEGMSYPLRYFARGWPIAVSDNWNNNVKLKLRESDKTYVHNDNFTKLPVR